MEATDVLRRELLCSEGLSPAINELYPCKLLAAAPVSSSPPRRARSTASTATQTEMDAVSSTVRATLLAASEDGVETVVVSALVGDKNMATGRGRDAANEVVIRRAVVPVGCRAILLNLSRAPSSR